MAEKLQQDIAPFLLQYPAVRKNGKEDNTCDQADLQRGKAFPKANHVNKKKGSRHTIDQNVNANRQREHRLEFYPLALLVHLVLGRFVLKPFRQPPWVREEYPYFFLPLSGSCG
ncbi:hypothetical protein [Phaeodactylibacter xiamenensis]|uniref:hypothetical protein n=1 Tax=Phaeodactylibacter xiamenensis TaxID=1524460 RepID=UPI0024A7ADAC|nr:hypothetical protein [Phaeodactylibacter xiamenensis]